MMVVNNEAVKKEWGSFTIVFNGKNYRVVLIEVLPYQKLSLQSHQHRSENWFVVEGSAKIILEGKENILKANDTIAIPIGAKHQLINLNNETLVVLEIRRGDYLEDDDIVRYE